MPARPSPWVGHVLITGAGSGIGAELARAAAGRGATALSLVDLNTAAAKGIAEELQAAHPALKVSVFGADVSNYAAVKAAVDGAFAANGPISVLAANAGLPCSGLFTEVSPTHGRKMVRYGTRRRGIRAARRFARAFIFFFASAAPHARA